MSWPLVKPPWKHLTWYKQDNTLQNAWPCPPTPHWLSVDEVASTKEITDLDKLKEQIEILDIKGEWEFLKRTSNPYELVFSQSQDTRIPPSISNIT